MSKFVKNLISNDVGKRLEGVEEALLVNVIGLDANQTVVLRKELRRKTFGCSSSRTAWLGARPKGRHWPRR